MVKELSTSDDSISLRDGLASAGDGEDPVVNTLDNLADASLHTSLVSEISDVLASLANDHTGLLGGNDGTKGKLGLGVLLFSAGSRLAIGTESGLSVIDLELVKRTDKVIAVGRDGVLRGRHIDCLVDRRSGKCG